MNILLLVILFVCNTFCFSKRIVVRFDLE